MEMRDVDDIRAGAPLISRVSPEIFREYPIRSTNRVTSAGVRGVNHEYGLMRGHYIQEGRRISSEDVQLGRRVAILGRDMRVKLFSEAPALGEEIRINGLSFKVIGVLQKKVAMSNYFRPDDQCIFVPHTAIAALTSTRYLSVMVVQSVNPAFEDQALMHWRFMQNIFDGIQICMKILLVVIGILTLSIGGVGLMNVMLVSVTERTREIGLLKALGARRHHIRTQFLFEALIIAAIGGFLGYAFAQLVALAIGIIPFWSTILEDPTQQADIHLIMSPSAIVTAIVTLGLVGLFSGLFPAIRASRLDPVEALHYE
jgi:putative ABC transport system permease protein